MFYLIPPEILELPQTQIKSIRTKGTSTVIELYQLLQIPRLIDILPSENFDSYAISVDDQKNKQSAGTLLVTETQLNELRRVGNCFKSTVQILRYRLKINSTRASSPVTKFLSKYTFLGYENVTTTKSGKSWPLQATTSNNTKEKECFQRKYVTR